MKSRVSEKKRPVSTFVLGVALGVLLVSAIPFVFGQTPKKPVQASQEEISLVNQLRERGKILAAREQELTQKAEELNVRQAEIDEKLTRLITLQNELKVKLEELKSIKDKRFFDLVKVYGAMSPSKVAPLLNQMADEEALEILKAMKTDQVAKIMPKLDQGKAVRLSKLLGLL